MKLLKFSPVLVVSLVVMSVGLLLAPPAAFSEQSPSYGEVAVKVGLYYPDIDKEFENKKPFESFFGPEQLWLFELELGAFLWQDVGRLGVALHAGYASDEAEVVASGSSSSSSSSKKAADTTSIAFYPLTLSLFYTFDYLAVEYNIPLSLTLDGGIMYVPWLITDANGDTAVFNGKPGRGGVWGWRASAQLAFLLNIFDENAAALFDMSWGVNRSYLFAEFVYQQVDNFGSKKTMNLSDAYFQLGVRFDF